MTRVIYQDEIDEAIEAADEALDYLYEAKEALFSAGNWGIVDMLGGGLFTTFLKHSKMNNASEALEDAKRAIHHFKDELEDVDRILDVNLNTGDFLSFADYFFDGLVTDWLMQSRISEAKKQVNYAISEIKDIKAELEAL